jgi:hypothetical protein
MNWTGENKMTLTFLGTLPMIPPPPTLKTYILKFETLTPFKTHITTLLKAYDVEEAKNLADELYLENSDYPCVLSATLFEIEGSVGKISEHIL